MTNEQAFGEFQYAVNHWFRFMDEATRKRAVQVAENALSIPIEAIVHRSAIQQQVIVSKPVEACSGRGMHFAGKAWMLNRSTGERARVDHSEVAAYESRGFVRGGPRSK